MMLRLVIWDIYEDRIAMECQGLEWRTSLIRSNIKSTVPSSRAHE